MKNDYKRRLIALIVLTAFFTAAYVYFMESEESSGKQDAPARWITFDGRGKGHGVGMCMAGVYYRTLRGEDRYSIISHYYTGIAFSSTSDERVIRVKCRDGVIRSYTMRDYLYRLAEEPDTWPREGLRVLMIAARTYTLSVINRGKHAAEGFDICPFGSCCQAFNENIDITKRPNTVAAVNETSGEIIVYNGEPIISAYSSCCGGYTASWREAWGSHRPYCLAVPDDACRPADTHSWERVMKTTEIQGILNQHADTYVGEVLSITVETITESGRAATVKIVGSDAVKTVSGNRFANVMGFPTNFFTVVPENFDTFLLLLNPGDNDASVNIKMITPEGHALDVPVSIGANSRLTFKANDYMSQAEMSFIINSTEPIACERAMYFEYRAGSVKGGSVSAGAVEPLNRWFFAEGYTGGEFDTYLLLMNPNDTEGRANIKFFIPGGLHDEMYYDLPPMSRITICVNNLPGLNNTDVSAEVESTVPIVAERSMYFDYFGRDGGHDSVGVNDYSQKWHFAEGYTGNGFDTWILIGNTSENEAKIKMEFMDEQGNISHRDYLVEPQSRHSVFLNHAFGPDGNVSVKLTSDVPVVAERSMYFNYMGIWKGGDNKPGVAEPSDSWLLPEGCTLNGFDTWILIQNPQDEDAEVEISYMNEDGLARSDTISMPALSRYTIFVNNLQGMDGKSFATYVNADVPIICERSMYFNYGGRDGGHVSTGISEPSNNWYFAEGYTGI